jgi:tetratricopeptide (TPR) repeat protein
MKVFIVRPFSKKGGVDFDAIEDELIKPAMKAAKVSGGTTGLIARSGNIRVDMFEQLLLADLVIADVSVHNANVFYELGLRHALRHRPTIMIRFAQPKTAAKKKSGMVRSRSGSKNDGPNPDDVPFDLRTDRYLEYDLKRPRDSVAALTAAITDSLKAKNTDSPVYLLLPELRPPSTGKLRAVAEEFREAVDKAAEKGDFACLGLLAEEVDDVPWRQAARRLVGKTFFEKKSWAGARIWLEKVREEDPDDVEANLLLGTVYQKLGDLAESSAALKRVLDQEELNAGQRAEKLSLVGSNYKTEWIAEWQSLPAEARPTAALRKFTKLAVDAYDEGFNEDQNHYYSGLNALSLRTLQIELIKALPAVWQSRFNSEKEALDEQTRLARQRDALEGAVSQSLQAARKRDNARISRQKDKGDYWIDFSLADFGFLAGQKPSVVAQGYLDALAVVQGRFFSSDSAARQLRIFRDLGIFVEKAEAAILALGEPLEKAPEVPKRQRVILFSGHRIDGPKRKSPRFPASREAAAAAAIRREVLREKQAADGAPIKGIAGAANGGDIIFLEVCRAEGIPIEILLALPENEYAAASVNDGGPDWTERFRKLIRAKPPKMLANSSELPSWVADKTNYSIWNRNNLWTLHAALAHIQADVTLIALFDGKAGDGPGGTADMIERARRAHVNVIVIDPAKLGDGKRRR